MSRRFIMNAGRTTKQGQQISFLSSRHMRTNTVEIRAQWPFTKGVSFVVAYACLAARPISAARDARDAARSEC